VKERTCDEEDPVHGRADYWDSEAARSRSEDSGPVPGVRDQRGDVLQLELEVRLANGRMVRIFSVVDAFTRECLALEADTSLGSGPMTRVLDRLIDERGQPKSVRSDAGAEFTSRRMLGWAESARST